MDEKPTPHAEPGADERAHTQADAVLAGQLPLAGVIAAVMKEEERKDLVALATARASGGLLNARQASKHLAICERTFREMVTRREVNPVRIGRRQLFEIGALDALIRSRAA